MKARTTLLLTAFLIACVASKGLLLTEITRLKSELKNTMDLQVGKLRERKLAVVSSRRLDSGLSQSQTAPRVPRYLKPTTPRQLKDLEIKKTAQRQHSSNSLAKSASTPKIDRYLKPNQPRNLANSNTVSKPSSVPALNQNTGINSNNIPSLNAKSKKIFGSQKKKVVHRVNKRIHQKVVRKNMNVLKKTNIAPILKSRTAKFTIPRPEVKKALIRKSPKKAKKTKKAVKAKKANHAKKIVKAKVKKVKAALKAKKALKSKQVVKAKRVVKAKKLIRKSKHVVKAKKSRHLQAGLNESDNKLLDELSKKVQAMKEKATENNDKKAKVSSDQTSPAPARKLKNGAAQERNLLDLPSQEEFYSSIVNDYSSRF